jgi:manganese-dependent inorganic pyrophosphatase
MNIDNLKTKEIIYITGHKNPDTDSICSAIAYADLKRNLKEEAISVRIGKINRETQFVLEYFEFETPEYLATVKTQISDLNMDLINPVSPNISIREAWQILKKNNLDVLPVKNSEEVLIGIVSVSDIANAYMNMPGSNVLSTSFTPVENVIETLEAELIYNSGISLKNSGKAVIAAMTPEGMGEFIEKGDIVFVGDIKANQMKAIDAGASYIIVTCRSKIGEDVIEFAKAHQCTILVTKYDTFSAARLLYQSIPIEFTMTSQHLVSFNIDDFVDNVKEKMLQTRFRRYPVVDSDHHFKGFISRYHLLNQRRKKVILIDHSEKSQSVNGIEQAEILEIVDHHRIGDIQTMSPIYYRNEPTGSTATIIANLYSEHSIKLSAKIAGILCAAILSDTIKFKSPTCTQVDRITAEWLSQLAGIDIETFSAKMFEAGSSLKNLTTEEIVQNDFKEYVVGRHKIGIGQVNTTDFGSLRKLRNPILNYLNGLSTEKGYSILLLLITDIIDEETEVLFVEDHKGLVAKAFSPLKDENSFSMSGVVSRKKQIVPRLIAGLS